MKTKICSKCKEELSINEFSRDKTSKDGLNHYCRACDSIKSKQWHIDNIDHCKEYKNVNNRTPRGRLNCRMYSFLYLCLKGRIQTSPTLQALIGYSPQELRKHFEFLFTEGMNWQTYGEWEIDHITPICSFDYSTIDEPEFQACWALSNLQPLWHEDNMAKGRNII